MQNKIIPLALAALLPTLVIAGPSEDMIQQMKAGANATTAAVKANANPANAAQARQAYAKETVATMSQQDRKSVV